MKKYLNSNMSKINYILMAIGIFLVSLGYVIMSLGDWTISPIVLIVGYVIVIPCALLIPARKDNQSKNNESQN